MGLKITDFISMNSACIGELENNTLYPLSLTLKLPLIHSNGCEFMLLNYHNYGFLTHEKGGWNYFAWINTICDLIIFSDAFVIDSIIKLIYEILGNSKA